MAATNHTVSATARSSTPAQVMIFREVYAEHFDFVWRTLLRLGVPENTAEDAAQEVFVVVHRKLPQFEGRSSIKTWIYAITRRVASDHRRANARRVALQEAADKTNLVELRNQDEGPLEAAARAQGAQIIDALLEKLDDTKREVFILSELEEMTAPEIAELLDVKLSTVYTRISAARAAFNQALERYQARHQK